MAKLFFDLTGNKGLAPKFYGDLNDTGGQPQRRTIGKAGQMAQGYWNPYRAFGYLTQPNSMVNSSIAVTESDGTYNFDSDMKASLYDASGTTGSNGKGIWLCDKTSVWYNGGGGTANAPILANALHLATNTPKITDMEVYQVNGTKKIFVSYEETTGAGGDIAIVAPDAGSSTATWLSATVSGAFQTGATNEVVMVAADNSYMYILDGSAVHKIDGTSAGGTNGTAYPNILLFPPDFVLNDAVDWKAHLWIAVQTSLVGPASNGGDYNERVVGIYCWDRQSVTTNMQDFIPITGVRDIRKVYVTPQGELRILCISSERFTQIRRYNGSTFDVVEEMGIWAYPPRRDSVSVTGGLVVWIGNDGNIYGHGKLPATQTGTGAVEDQLYMLGAMAGLPNTDFTPGAILVYGGGGVGGTFANAPTSSPSIIFSYSDSSSNFKVYNWIINGVGTISSKAQVGDAGSVYTLAQRLPGLAHVNWVRVWHLPQGSGGTTTMGTLTIYKNQSSSAITNGAVSITQTDIQRGYRFIPLGDKGFNDFALQFQIAWQTSAAMSDSTDWMPYAIEVDYDETTKLK